MAMVGDVALGNHPKAPGFGFYSRYSKGIPRDLARRVLPPGSSPQVVLGNLEFALATDAGLARTDVCCLGSVSYISFLREAGFTVVNVANNHSWQHGPEVFRQTVKSLRGAGLKVVGIPDDFDPAGFLRIQGQTVAILGCSARPRQGFATRPDYNEFEKAQFLERIRDARRHSDLVCVSIHWGEEFVLIPSAHEREIAHEIIDAGAGLVVGHHPHVLREIECYKEGVIAYSLGNFIGDMIWNPRTRETGCLLVKAKGSRVDAEGFFPAMIDRDYFPRYLDESTGRELLDTQVKRQARLRMNLEARGYESLARKALKNHQKLTLGFLLKNLYRYRLSTLARIVFHAILVRLQRGNG